MPYTDPLTQLSDPHISLVVPVRLGEVTPYWFVKLVAPPNLSRDLISQDK